MASSEGFINTICLYHQGELVISINQVDCGTDFMVKSLIMVFGHFAHKGLAVPPSNHPLAPTNFKSPIIRHTALLALHVLECYSF